MNILISNDDGIQAPGILVLAQVAKEFGEVMIVAPDSPQSAMGHAISLGKPLRLYKEKLADGSEGYACNGTPADCVKLATGILMREKLPTLVLSGINHGANFSVSSIYSGTLSAAREGAIQGIPAVGFSVLDHHQAADFSEYKEILRKVIAKAISEPLASGDMLNVNIPRIPMKEIKGIKVVRQAMGRWVEEFDERTDPFGEPYYWLTGKFLLQDTGIDTDHAVLKAGYVSVTPMMHDLTDYRRLDITSMWEF